MIRMMALSEVFEGGQETKETGEDTTGDTVVNFVAASAAEPERKPRLLLDISEA